MAVSQRLDIRQGQSLIMTPQLQQAIKLLQLSNIELAEYIEGELEANPLLQCVDENNTIEQETSLEGQSSEDELNLNAADNVVYACKDLDAPSEDAFEPDSKTDIVSESPDGNSNSLNWSESNNSGSTYGTDFEATYSHMQSLHEYLHMQLSISALSPIERMIAARLIDETDDTGYLTVNLAELSDMLGVELEDTERVLETCQHFEPAGVMARSISECLKLQLIEHNRYDPAIAVMLNHLDLVGQYNIKALSEICAVSEADIYDMIEEIRALTPRPGSSFSNINAITIIPDVFVRELPDGAFAVELNTATLPKVLLDRTYYSEISSHTFKQSDKDFLAECANNANWLIKSLDQRARTILKVSQEIVRQQDRFFVHGVSHLRPLNLKTVAEIVDMHESTISRVTSNKYMATSRGVFELKYFFSAAIPNISGGEAHSAETVRYHIKSVIDRETTDDILSDDQIVVLLRDFGIDIARRTVAKYRESLGIPSSVQRRRLLSQRAKANTLNA